MSTPKIITARRLAEQHSRRKAAAKANAVSGRIPKIAVEGIFSASVVGLGIIRREPGGAH